MQWLWNIGYTQTYLRNAGEKVAGCWKIPNAIPLIEFLLLVIQRIAQRPLSTKAIRYRNQRAAPTDKYNRRYSPSCWYNHIRIYQKLNGRTPAAAWCGANSYTRSPNKNTGLRYGMDYSQATTWGTSGYEQSKPSRMTQTAISHRPRQNTFEHWNAQTNA